MTKIDKDMQASLMAIINKRKKAMMAGEVLNNDLLGILLESNKKEIQENGNNKNVGMSDQEVLEECNAFYLGGQESTSVLLVWTMILLSRYPHWQASARKEVLQVFGNQMPNIDGISRLKIVSIVRLTSLD
jgi:cytochrome P450